MIAEKEEEKLESCDSLQKAHRVDSSVDKETNRSIPSWLERSETSLQNSAGFGCSLDCTATEMQSTNENELECLPSTGVKSPLRAKWTRWLGFPGSGRECAHPEIPARLVAYLL